MKVIIDTNIWISFLIGHHKELVHNILTDTRFDVYVCRSLINEICDVASRGKIRKYVSESDTEELLAVIGEFCKHSDIEAPVPATPVRDPKDLYILSLAEAIAADYIVSGDADLLDLEHFGQALIVNLANLKTLMQYRQS